MRCASAGACPGSGNSSRKCRSEHPPANRAKRRSNRWTNASGCSDKGIQAGFAIKKSAEPAEKIWSFGFFVYLCTRNCETRHAEIAQLVERNLAKVEVAGPSPVFRSRKWLIISRLSTIFFFSKNTEDGQNVCHNKQNGG